MGLALNNLQRLICHKTQPTNQIIIIVKYINFTSISNYLYLYHKNWYEFA